MKSNGWEIGKTDKINFKVTISSWLKLSKQCIQVIEKVNEITELIEKSLQYKCKETVLILCNSVVRLLSNIAWEHCGALIARKTLVSYITFTAA